MKTKKLSSDDRTLINLTAQAAFVNPFTKLRMELNREIVGMSRESSKDPDLEEVIGVITELIRRLDEEGTSSIKDVAISDKQSAEYLYLFDVYHCFRFDFDDLILKQIAAGDKACAVPFAGDVVRQLMWRGFSEGEALKMLGIFYQIRRAFFFIGRNLSGESECIRYLRRSLWDNIFTHDIRWYNQTLVNRMEDFSTLLLGETGTGKGAAAAAIGSSGFIPYDTKQGKYAESFTSIFIPINLSQFPETLIESELFGHTKGAFTGAVEAHDGIFALSSPHGSIFLDEIGDVSIPIQIKLLQILQEREFTPVGSHTKQRFDGRVIAATNKPMEQLRREGAFRDDFFYRLCSDMIVVPPLRQRIAENAKELDLLLKSVLIRLTGEDNPELYKMVYAAIQKSPGRDYHWPGNVRELEQCVRRILLTKSYTGDTPHINRDLQTQIVDTIQKEGYDAQNLLADYCRLLYYRHGSYQDVARITGLDRRTVKKYVEIRRDA